MGYTMRHSQHSQHWTLGVEAGEPLHALAATDATTICSLGGCDCRHRLLVMHQGRDEEPVAQEPASATSGAGLSRRARRHAPPPDSAALWWQFYREQTRRNMSGDKLAAGILMAVAVAARLQVGEHETTRQEVHSGCVLALGIAVMVTADDVAEEGWLVARVALVFALKLAVATAPLFKLSALALLQASAMAAEATRHVCSAKPGPHAIAAAISLCAPRRL